MSLFKPWESKDMNKQIKWVKEVADENNPKHLKILLDIAKNSDYSEIGLDVINKLTNVEALSDIAKNAKWYDVRRHAYKKLGQEESQDALTDLVLNTNQEEEERLAVIKKITDQNALGLIAQHFKHSYNIFEAVIMKLTNQQILVSIYNNNSDKNIRIPVIKRITDQRELTKIALNEYDPYLRIKAVRNLTEKTVLEEIAKNDRKDSIRAAAIENLIKKLDKMTDEKILADIAINTSYPQICLAAIKKIKNKEILSNISNNISDNDLYFKGKYVDPRDKKEYKTVLIDGQLWLAQNFAYKPESGNYWIYENDEKNLEKYGYFYDWETAKQACPNGWHLPSDDEIYHLIEYLCPFDQIQLDEGDRVCFQREEAYKALLTGGDSGFSAHLSGYYSSISQEFMNHGISACFWTTSEGGVDNQIYILELTHESNIVNFKEYKWSADLKTESKEEGCSLRLIKDY